MEIGNIGIGNIFTLATLNNRIAEMRNCAYIQYPTANIQSDVGRWMLPALSYFFGSDAPENVMLERFWTAKELRLGSAHSHSGVEETARLIDKYTQFSGMIFHDDCSFNRKRRKFLSATYAETFPRIQVVPAFRPSPTHMLPNFRLPRNKASVEISFRRAA